MCAGRGLPATAQPPGRLHRACVQRLAALHSQRDFISRKGGKLGTARWPAHTEACKAPPHRCPHAPGARRWVSRGLRVGGEPGGPWGCSQTEGAAAPAQPPARPQVPGREERGQERQVRRRLQKPVSMLRLRRVTCSSSPDT